jgi:hypothetical protein
MINIINFLDKHNGSIMCFLTLGTMIFAAVTARATVVTAKIAKKKRKDDLFKIRYDLYDEIVNFIEKQLSCFNSPIYLNLSEPGVMLEYLIYSAAVKKLKNRVRLLFDEELAIWLEAQLMNGSFSKYKHYKEKQIDYFWFPHEEFTKKFDEYLKLNKV